MKERFRNRLQTKTTQHWYTCHNFFACRVQAKQQSFYLLHSCLQFQRKKVKI